MTSKSHVVNTVKSNCKICLSLGKFLLLIPSYLKDDFIFFKNSFTLDLGKLNRKAAYSRIQYIKKRQNLAFG